MTQVALLYPGEMGALVGAAAHAEVWWPGDGRSAATRARAEAAGFRDGGTLAATVTAADVVLSVCPPAIAEAVAAEVVEAGFRGLYVEANAISPTRAERIEAAGGRVVDGAVISRSGVSSRFE